MDPRVEQLLTDFPGIFDKRPPRLGDLEDDWVIINVAGNPNDPNKLESDDEFLSDLDRYESDSSAEPKDLYPYAGLDIILPPDIDISLYDLIEILRRPRPRAIEELRRRVKGNFPGAPMGFTPRSVVPWPDALAFYLPFHIFPDMWGIYLLDMGVESLATDLRRIVRLLGRSISQMDARRIARAYLFHHEAYHCAVESFAMRCELARRKPVYRTGSNRIYRRGYIAGQPHEERLAGAHIEPGGKHVHLVRLVTKAGLSTPRRTQVPSGEIHRGTLSGMLRDLGLNLNVEGFREECRKARRPV